MTLPIATYRLQMRGGLDFDEAIEWLPHLVDLGVSHLYLSPIFTATAGSTHGYDITDPTRIDPVLGGADGFDRLAAAAQEAGLGIILDLVPNHTAFSLENQWLVDVLRNGRDSVYARHFDIDWDEGPLVLPWLSETFEALTEAGKVTRESDTLKIDELTLPLRPGTQGTDPIKVHDQQYWRLTHHMRERDSVTHRRFFNVTGLIGMRVGDPRVWDDMHSLPLRLVAEGKVQGLRLDHIDGLADPAAYLDRLRHAVGADVPIWVEKILTGDETLPEWPVEGTTGYEAATMIARALTDTQGAARLYAEWGEQTGETTQFHDHLETAKGEVIRRDLAAELRRLITLGGSAIDPAEGLDPGEETLREAFLALLVAFPRYRTYFIPSGGSTADRALMERVADSAAEGLRSRDVLDAMVRRIVAPENEAEVALQRRFQQVTGALVAKSHEDTAGFRFTPYLPACEVGADPDHPATTVAEFETWARAQPGTGILLTSTHDTKRSEDARMRMVACSHLPDDVLALIAQARVLPEAAVVPVNVQWYVVQSALALWGTAPADELAERLRNHVTKALREADQITSWTHPDAQTEGEVLSFLSALLDAWQEDGPPQLERLITRGEILSLSQLALKMVLPGCPDIYRGCEGGFFALTDPDNRASVDLTRLRGLGDGETFDDKKAWMTRELLRLRARERAIFSRGDIQIVSDSPNALKVIRSLEGSTVVLTLSLDGVSLENQTDMLLTPFISIGGTAREFA